MANNIKAYFFLSFFVIINPYSQVDFFNFKPLFFSVMLSSCRACHVNLAFYFCCCGSFTAFFFLFSISKHPFKTFFFYLSGN